MELRALIETSLRQSASSASAASSSFRTQQAGEQAPPPLHANPRIRPTEEVAPADADVAVLHSADMTAGKGPKGLNGGAKAGKVRHRRGSVDPRSSSESLHSL